MMNTQPVLSDDEKNLLKKIARAIIPAASEKGLPGADDKLIFERLLLNAEEQLESLRADLHELLTEEGGITAFRAADDATFNGWISDWADRWPHQTHAFFKSFVPMLLRAYYQDSRVHLVYDRRPGPPFPEGYVIIEGDWSLLDKVRERSPLYRS